VDRDIPNAGDQVPVVPTPVRIWSVEASSKTTDAYTADVVRTIVFALNQLAYLRSVNPDAYQSAVSGYVELLSGGDSAKAEAVNQLASLAGTWGQ
jgi:hypothetical protein